MIASCCLSQSSESIIIIFIYAICCHHEAPFGRTHFHISNRLPAIAVLANLQATSAHTTTVSSTDLPIATDDASGAISRAWCHNHAGNPHSLLRHNNSTHRRRLHALRQQMRAAGVHAYIVTGLDEHLNDDVAERDRRREYISGFGGRIGDAVVTHDALAMWTNDRHVAQANYELDCDWQIYSVDRAASTNVTAWLAEQLPADACVGADPATVPHQLWHAWQRHLAADKAIRLLRLPRNLVDEIWGAERPAPNADALVVHGLHYAGERYGAKLRAVRHALRAHKADAMVVSALTEIAWVLNLRGNDLPYTPVFKVS